MAKFTLRHKRQPCYFVWDDEKSNWEDVKKFFEWELKHDGISNFSAEASISSFTEGESSQLQLDFNEQKNENASPEETEKVNKLDDKNLDGLKTFKNTLKNVNKKKKHRFENYH